MHVHVEAGFVGQCVSLQEVALGLGTVMIDAFDGRQVHLAERIALKVVQ